MTTFTQIHTLTSYPPANLNRDDLGRPKTAMFGGWNRLRVSSQCLKRTWRASDCFVQSLIGERGIRTKEMGRWIYEALLAGRTLQEQLQMSPVKDSEFTMDKKNFELACTLAEVFGKRKKESKEKPYLALEIEQLAHFAPEEVAALDALMARAKEGEIISDKDLAALRKQGRAVDIAMFGRMLAQHPAHNVDAAVQVAHALSVHAVTVQEDYFTAVDDLNTGEEDMGAGHIGVNEFAAGLFYLYVCINNDLLLENLDNDAALAARTRRALVEAMLTTAPSGKQNSFGSRSLASFALVERGTFQPRNLSLAFLKPVSNGKGGMLGNAIEALQATRENIDKVYGPCADARQSFDALAGTGTLQDLLAFVEG